MGKVKKRMGGRPKNPNGPADRKTRYLLARGCEICGEPCARIVISLALCETHAAVAEKQQVWREEVRSWDSQYEQPHLYRPPSPPAVLSRVHVDPNTNRRRARR